MTELSNLKLNRLLATHGKQLIAQAALYENGEPTGLSVVYRLVSLHGTRPQYLVCHLNDGDDVMSTHLTTVDELINLGYLVPSMPTS